MEAVLISQLTLISTTATSLHADNKLLPHKRLTTDTGNQTHSAVLQNRVIRSTDGESPRSTPNLRFSTLHN